MHKYLKVFFMIVFIIFLVAYISEKTGYYEYTLRNRKVMTEEKIKEFEHDVSSGKDIDINDYTVNTYVDYSNKFTGMTVSVSNTINKYFKKAIKGGFKILNKLISD